ncbi:MAG: L-threonylcarbamoyladenylate synthase [Actinomycetia bacterium]|jgi:tRNA threonylcarbamoyl adenosine modification protein (Sua5/YciO/YrdC/YwlC family)|nr:L-threonylcarbamoyladenylate synthase [Actinomycetes bacterium]
MRRVDCADPAERARGLELAAQAARRGELVVLPTDTVYGLGCDAFSAEGVEALLYAKGRGRDMPVPVLVGSVRTLAGLTGALGTDAERLVDAFWPGPLTLVVRQAASLAWDLGDSRGTVAVRMPLHPLAIELLRAVGPMAVSSANRTGEPPATTCDEAVAQLGEAVSVYLDAGPTAAPVPSSIVDLTGPQAQLLRVGAIDAETLRTVVPDLAGPA